MIDRRTVLTSGIALVATSALGNTRGSRQFPSGFLWGAGDLALMFIESNHDLRATRILIGRLNGKMDRLAGVLGAT